MRVHVLLRPAVFACAALGAAAQSPPPPAPPPPAPPPADSIVVEVGPRDHASGAPLADDSLAALAPPPVLDAYRADPDFQYDRPEAEGPSLWDRFWGWLRRMFWDPVAESTSAGFRETVLVLLAVGVLGWVVTRLLRAEGSGVFGRRAPEARSGALLDVEAIAEVDLGARLSAALADGDWRQAVRLRYLLALQALDAAGALAWRIDKTNREYAAEVAAADPALARPFRQATRAFDAVWYGDRPVSERLYGRLAPVFDRVTP